jgi:hypothetical protein
MRHFLLRTSALIALTSALSANAEIATACEGRTTIFEDRFTDSSGGWDTGPQYAISGGVMKINLSAERGGLGVFNSMFDFRDADVCVDFRYPTTAFELQPIVGLSFWIDGATQYVAHVDSLGNTVVRRYVDGGWHQVALQVTDAVNRQENAPNRLRVLIRAGLITVYVNNKKVTDVRAKPPEKAERWGILASRAKSGQEQTFTITYVKVTSAD